MNTKKFIAHVGAEFLDHEGRRHFSFQLCLPKKAQPKFADHPKPEAHIEAHACADLDNNGQIVRYHATAKLATRKNAILRLARRHHSKRIPVGS